MERELLDFLAEERTRPRKGHSLRLLTAKELLEARREAEAMEGEPETRGLRSNACLLSRAVSRGGDRVFPDGNAVLEAWSGEKIAREAAAYRKFAAQADPDWANEPGIRHLTELLQREPEERIKWKVLKAFGVLPSESRAREMTRRDYLYCALHLTLDREEQLNGLCPGCRSRAEGDYCSCCGAPIAGEGGKNPAFDEKRFEELKRGG